ncbi:hypothetical protein KKC91_03085 [bacterium]|nr:hypothetical protein [bacterium]
MIEEEQAKRKAEEIKDILKRKFNQEAQVDERRLRWEGKYYKLTWSTLGRGKWSTFLSVCTRGWLKIHERNPSKHPIPYKDHLDNLVSKGFRIIGEDTDGLSYVDWDIPNLAEFVKLQFEYYT